MLKGATEIAIILSIGIGIKWADWWICGRATGQLGEGGKVC